MTDAATRHLINKHLREGLGVEDISVLTGIHEATVRRHIQDLRETGGLEPLLDRGGAKA